MNFIKSIWASIKSLFATAVTTVLGVVATVSKDDKGDTVIQFSKAMPWLFLALVIVAPSFVVTLFGVICVTWFILRAFDTIYLNHFAGAKAA